MFVLVTGASRGIGAACARGFAARGWQPVLFARGAEVERLADELGTLAVRGDLTRPDDLNRLVSTTVDAFGRVDGVLVSTGDPAASGDLLDITDGQWHTWLDLLFLNTVRLARLLTPHLVAGGGGAWVNIGSADLREPDLAAPYSATIRNCLSGFTKLYARTHAHVHIRMNVVSPSYAWDTPDQAGRWAGTDIGGIGRAATYLVVASAAAFLLSDEASYISGVDLKVDAAGYSRAM